MTQQTNAKSISSRGAKRTTATTGKKAATKTGRKTGKKKLGKLVPQPHGGALLDGVAANHVPGPGRPPNQIREKLRELSYDQGLPFLASLMDGEVNVTLVGKCEHCEKHTEMTPQHLKNIATAVSTSVDHRLKGLEQIFRYGVGTKDEVDVMSHPDAIKFTTAYREAVMQEGPEVAHRVMERIANSLGLQK